MASDKIRSVDDLLESLKGTQFIKDSTIYRGQSNYNWEIKPSLLRQPLNNKPKLVELTLFAPLHQDLNIPFLETKDPIEYLTILQHYGISTRLLDCSKDPLVALFFSCYDNKNLDIDGVFIVTDKLNFNNATIRNAKHEFFVNKYKDLPNEKYRDRIYSKEIMYFEPVFSNPRSRCQNGCFLFFPFNTFNETDSNYINLDDYVRFVNNHNKKQNSDNRVFLAKKNVDKNFKKNILAELESKHSISYESLMLPNLTTSVVESEFKSLLNRIEESYEEIKDIYEKNVKTK